MSSPIALETTATPRLRTGAVRSFAPVLWIAVSLLGSLLLTGCQSITADSADAAQVRFVDASVDAPALDLYLNGNGAAYNLSFATVTSYLPVGPGEYHITANRGGSAQALVNTRTTLGVARQYTAVVSNTLGNLQETIYPDASAPAPAGMLAVRLLHVAAAVGPLDVYLVPSAGALAGSSPVVRGLAYEGSGGYFYVPAGGSYTVAVQPAGVAPGPASGGLLSGVSVSGISGAVRTVVIGDAPTGSAKTLSGLVLDDFDTP